MLVRVKVSNALTYTPPGTDIEEPLYHLSVPLRGGSDEHGVRLTATWCFVVRVRVRLEDLVALSRVIVSSVAFERLWLSGRLERTFNWRLWRSFFHLDRRRTGRRPHDERRG